jgi:DegV family protein with EDD domain
MKKVHIVTDSMCHIPPSLCQELEIHVVPLPFVWDGVSYLDDEIAPREFYSRLRMVRTFPKTSGPTPGSFKDEFESLGSDGKPVLAILVGNDFSSTIKAATLAKEMCPPSMDITIFNSDSNTMGLGFQVLAAARAAREGKELKEILQILIQVRQNSGVIFAVPNLDYLRHGGRISHLQRFVASTFNLIPIMEIQGGPIKPVERVRHHKNVIPRLIQLVEHRVDNKKPVRIAVVHADEEEGAWALAKEVRSSLNPEELEISELTPVLAVHTGPDALGLAYSTGI